MESREEIRENTETAWVCDSPEKADWAIEKIKEIRARRDLFINVAEQKINTLKEQIEEQERSCENQESFFAEALNQYLDTVPAKKTKTQISLELPAGKIVRKISRPDFAKDDAKLLEYLKESSPDFVSWTPKVKWADFKKSLQIQGDAVVRTDTGEILDCIRVEMSPERIEIK